MNAEFQFKHEIPVQIRFSDVDQYGHMNNSVYFSLYDLAKTSYFRDVFGAEECNKFSVVVVNINADFLAPVQRAFNKASGVLKCQCRTVLVGYDNLTKEPIEIPEDYKQAICDYEGKTLSELSQPLQ